MLNIQNCKNRQCRIQKEEKTEHKKSLPSSSTSRSSKSSGWTNGLPAAEEFSSLDGNVIGEDLNVRGDLAAYWEGVPGVPGVRGVPGRLGVPGGVGPGSDSSWLLLDTCRSRIGAWISGSNNGGISFSCSCVLISNMVAFCKTGGVTSSSLFCLFTDTGNSL